MFLKLAIVIAVIVGGFLAYVAVQPPEMYIVREIVIQAEPQVIFPYINNSKNANDWMPWAESDPEMNIIYSGPAEGVGSMSSWNSPGKMGTGQALVVESVENQLVKTELIYTKPMPMQQLAEILLTPTGGETLVRWSVSGQNTFIGRVFCFFLNMDKVVGGEFEKGLRKLKETVEVL